MHRLFVSSVSGNDDGADGSCVGLRIFCTVVVWIWMLNALQVAGSEDEWLEKQIESEKSISELEQQIRQLKVSMHLFVY